MLTARQRQIISLHANGMTLQAVSKHLGISYSTCRNQAESAKKLLEARTLACAVVRALHYGDIRMLDNGETEVVERKVNRQRRTH